MYASTLPRSNWLRRASIWLAWYRHMPASSIFYVCVCHIPTTYLELMRVGSETTDIGPTAAEASCFHHVPWSVPCQRRAGECIPRPTCGLAGMDGRSHVAGRVRVHPGMYPPAGQASPFPGEHGLIRKAGESIAHMHPRRHQITTGGL